MLDLTDKLEINNVHGVNNSNMKLFKPLKNDTVEQVAKSKSCG